MEAPKEYIRIGFDLGDAYVKESKLKDIKRIDAVIFDCDGVLIDVRETYDKAISKTVKWIFEALTGHLIPEELVSDEIIFLFRRSGGFNDDCDIAYGILMFLLCEMPIKFLRELTEMVGLLRHEKGVAERIKTIKEKTYGENINFDVKILSENLKKFTLMLDETGVNSVDRAIFSSKNTPKEIYFLLKDFLYGSKRVGESVITTVFEEIFCGAELFRKMYGIEPRFFYGLGTINNSKIIINPETFSRLSTLISGARFGIVSGSRFAPAKYVLGFLLDLFNQKALVFLDDIEKIEGEYLNRGLLKVGLRKPNPYPLFKSAWGLEPFRMALYVGDSMEDALTVDRANKLDPRFIFAGVYMYTGARDKALGEFLKFGCDIISPSANEIPFIIEAVRRMRV
ncbi:MAG: hypothetical protein QXX56_02735 [Candidatus Bathyarchaeia archaeon]